jgi:hypothetical protein
LADEGQSQLAQENQQLTEHSEHVRPESRLYFCNKPHFAVNVLSYVDIFDVLFPFFFIYLFEFLTDTSPIA